MHKRYSSLPDQISALMFQKGRVSPNSAALTGVIQVSSKKTIKKDLEPKTESLENTNEAVPSQPQPASSLSQLNSRLLNEPSRLPTTADSLRHFDDPRLQYPHNISHNTSNVQHSPPGHAVQMPQSVTDVPLNLESQGSADHAARQSVNHGGLDTASYPYFNVQARMQRNHGGILWTILYFFGGGGGEGKKEKIAWKMGQYALKSQISDIQLNI